MAVLTGNIGSLRIKPSSVNTFTDATHNLTKMFSNWTPTRTPDMYELGGARDTVAMFYGDIVEEGLSVTVDWTAVVKALFYRQEGNSFDFEYGPEGNATGKPKETFTMLFESGSPPVQRRSKVEVTLTFVAGEDINYVAGTF